MNVKQPVDELESFQNAASPQFTRAVLRLAAAIYSGSGKERAAATERLRSLLAQTMSYSDLMGRRRLLLEADAVRHRKQPGTNMQFAAVPAPVFQKVSFEYALEDLLSREPRLAKNAEAVSEVYSRHGFALAKSADLTITKRIQKALAQLFDEGTTEPTAGQLLSSIGDWSEAYSRTVYRTNLGTAYAAGRFREAQDPEVAEVIGAFEYDAILDPLVRDNHRAAHGLLAATNDSVWSRFSPPMGYNCRCSLRLVDRFELKRRNLLHGGKVIQLRPPTFSQAFADKGFGRSRPDQGVYA